MSPVKRRSGSVNIFFFLVAYATWHMMLMKARMDAKYCVRGFHRASCAASNFLGACIT
jgi:hypothetical protein